MNYELVWVLTIINYVPLETAKCDELLEAITDGGAGAD